MLLKPLKWIVNSASSLLFTLIAALVLCALLTSPAATITARAQGESSGPEYRAYWVETFNTALGTHADIDRVIDAAVQSNANAIFAQVRRRGDSWYLDTKEPLTQVPGVGEPDENGNWTFDPLRYLIEQAHARSIEVHAFVIIGSIYNAHPTITGLPRDPKHVFNQHFWNSETGALYDDVDPRQWATRSLVHNPDGTSFAGHRYGAEWYIDLGHPEAAAYTVDVLTHLVKQYALDGIHLDRIRYPEAPIDRYLGQQPLGINTGYNETSVRRFKARHADAATYYQESDIGTNVGTETAPRIITAADVGYPRTNDLLWNDWRREQVTNFVRRLYLSATAASPRIKVSAALICFWTGPVASGGWERTESYYRVYQDWRAWAEEGILDVLVPMIYKREHVELERAQFDDWLAFTKELARANNRHALPGLGAFVNSVEGTLRQARRSLARAPFEEEEKADGVIFYALGNTTPGTIVGNSTNAAVTNNPFSYPESGISTPKRANENFFAALRTGASADGATRFEHEALTSLFPISVATPDMPWKSAPVVGHVMGLVKGRNDVRLDGAKVTIKNLITGRTRKAKTDGSGFYGALDLAQGWYIASARTDNCLLFSRIFRIKPGHVTTADVR
ncbi:MAG: family 10 glycosylhydrolase [Pyrinomonadaceae bacterium]|nr:family 10 glycosylhydrolase [Pyrinomonadaceae bacterium]